MDTGPFFLLLLLAIAAMTAIAALLFLLTGSNLAIIIPAVVAALLIAIATALQFGTGDDAYTLAERYSIPLGERLQEEGLERARQAVWRTVGLIIVIVLLAWLIAPALLPDLAKLTGLFLVVGILLVVSVLIAALLQAYRRLLSQWKHLIKGNERMERITEFPVITLALSTLALAAVLWAYFSRQLVHALAIFPNLASWRAAGSYQPHWAPWAVLGVALFIMGVIQLNQQTRERRFKNLRNSAVLTLAIVIVAISLKVFGWPALPIILLFLAFFALILVLVGIVFPPPLPPEEEDRSRDLNILEMLRSGAENTLDLFKFVQVPWLLVTNAVEAFREWIDRIDILRDIRALLQLAVGHYNAGAIYWSDSLQALIDYLNSDLPREEAKRIWEQQKDDARQRHERNKQSAKAAWESRKERRQRERDARQRYERNKQSAKAAWESRKERRQREREARESQEETKGSDDKHVEDDDRRP